MNQNHYLCATVFLALCGSLAFVSSAPAQFPGNFNTMPGMAPWNQYNSNPFVNQQMTPFQQFQYSRNMSDYLFLNGGFNNPNNFSNFNNPYWQFSPVVSQYGYYGNPWSPNPFNPMGAYQFYPGQNVPWWQNNGGNSFGQQMPNNPFLQQGKFNANGVGAGKGGGVADPANIFK